MLVACKKSDGTHPEVISASETWLTSEALDNEIQLIGFLSSRAEP